MVHKILEICFIDNSHPLDSIYGVILLFPQPKIRLSFPVGTKMQFMEHERKSNYDSFS